MKKVWPALFLCLFICIVCPAPSLSASCSEATVLALEESGEFLPPSALVDKIAADLQAIRNYDHYFDQIHVTPSWIPGELLVSLTADAITQLRAGTYHGLDSLNQVYGPVSVVDHHWMIPVVQLVFSACYNPDQLSTIYTGAPGVVYVEPNSCYNDAQDIWIDSEDRYVFKRGWGDCPSGCMAEHFWVFTVSDGVVQLVTEYGDPVPVEVGTTTWGGIKARFGGPK